MASLNGAAQTAVPAWVRARSASISSSSRVGFTPSAHWPEPHLDVLPAPDEGSVRVDVEYRVDPLQTDAFVDTIRDLEPIRRRDGAVTWAVYQDPGQNGRYVESFVVESWLEHLRQHERATVGDRAVQERIQRFHITGAPPTVTHLIAAKFGRL